MGWDGEGGFVCDDYEQAFGQCISKYNVIGSKCVFSNWNDDDVDWL